MKTAIDTIREALDELIELRSFLPERYSMIAVHVRMDKAIAALTTLKSLEGQEVVAWMATIRYPNGDESKRYAATKEGAAQLGYESTRTSGTVMSVLPLVRLTKSANP